MRHAPIAIKTAITIGNSAGNIDIPKAMPPSIACNHDPRSAQNSAAVTMLATPPMTAKFRTKLRNCFCKCGCSVSIDFIAWPILPFSDWLPVARTNAVPDPRTTKEPANRCGESSPPDDIEGVIATLTAISPLFGSVNLRTATDSPVSSDSSTNKSCDDNKVASAATRSPSVTIIISPRTTSRPAMCTRKPSRMTKARGLAKLRSASNTFSLRDSCTMVIATDKHANTNKNRASKRSPSNK